MKNNTENVTFLFLNFKKFIIVVLDEKNKVIYKKETSIENSTNNIEPINILCQTITSEELTISSPNIAVKPAINTKKCR